MPASAFVTMPLCVHPACSVPADWRVAVSLAWDGDALELTYQWPEGLRLPAPAAPRAELRADDLWRHSCAELFVADDATTAYREFNFSPSGQWAAYDFDAYRQRAAQLPEVLAPHIEGARHGVRVRLARTALPAAATHLGLSSVLEAADGTLSYWALAHAGAAPDFHHRACFALAL